MATEYLIRRGYQRIACITGPLDKTTALERLNGYRQAMHRAGLSVLPGYEVCGDFEFEGGLSSMDKLLALPQRPHAVFASNDAMAVGVYQALYKKGLRVPEDVAVIGYDDIQLAQYMTPPLTTIHQPKDSLGELAIDTLLHRLQEPGADPQVLVLTPELVIRESVGSLNGN
jgi:LacI family transcriptional regulator